MSRFTEQQAKLLNLLQDHLPIEPRPYLRLAQSVGLTEDRVIELVRQWSATGIIRRIGCSLDARRIGYFTTLVGAEVDPTEVDAVAGFVSDLPSVSHNYLRDHRTNLWFTLTVASRQIAQQILRDVSTLRGVRRLYLLPTLQLFKLSVQFDPRSRRGNSTGQPSAPGVYHPSPLERRVLAALEREFPLSATPFTNLAIAPGVSDKEFIRTTQKLHAARVIRRVGAVLNHRRIGVGGNAMVVWAVPEARIQEIGRYLAAQPEVSHAYWRPTYPDWPYPVYSMVHAADRQEVEALAAQWARRLNPADYQMLFTLREYKKKPVRLFQENGQAGARKGPRQSISEAAS